jgi:hypothetical protein
MSPLGNFQEAQHQEHNSTLARGSSATSVGPLAATSTDSLVPVAPSPPSAAWLLLCTLLEHLLLKIAVLGLLSYLMEQLKVLVCFVCTPTLLAGLSLLSCMPVNAKSLPALSKQLSFNAVLSNTTVLMKKLLWLLDSYVI